MSTSFNRLAARAVALHAPGSTAERRELLEVLGLIAPDGTITPDDNRIIEINPVGDVNPLDRVPQVREPALDRSLLPPGLRDLSPVEHPTRAKAEPNKRTRAKAEPKTLPPLSACGTLAGRGQHQRRGEELCQACKDAQAAYQRERRQRIGKVQRAPEKRVRKVNPNLPPRPETCGTLAGRSNHLRRGEKLCRPCADVFNAHQREARRLRNERAVTSATVLVQQFGEVVHVPGQMELYAQQERSA